VSTQSPNKVSTISDVKIKMINGQLLDTGTHTYTLIMYLYISWSCFKRRQAELTTSRSWSQLLKRSSRRPTCSPRRIACGASTVMKNVLVVSCCTRTSTLHSPA